jgi:hypothetical protein
MKHSTQGKIVVVGDVHQDHTYLNDILKEESPAVILQCGDFGFIWNKNSWRERLGTIKNPMGTKIFWCPGNHENYDMLESIWGLYGCEPKEVYPNIFYCPRGSRLVLNDELILFMGGALSVDKGFRILKKSWWQQEVLNKSDLCKCGIQDVDEVFMVISHTSPGLFGERGTLHGIGDVHDPTQDALDEVLYKVNPKYWFYGHWHSYRSFSFHGVQCTCLTSNTDRSGRGFVDITNIFKKEVPSGPNN